MFSGFILAFSKINFCILISTFLIYAPMFVNAKCYFNSYCFRVDDLIVSVCLLNGRGFDFQVANLPRFSVSIEVY